MLQMNLFKCPICQTSLIDMTMDWQRLDNERQHWLLPEQLRNFLVKVQCRDCRKESETNFHFIGLKCPSCGSYNTVRTGSEAIPLEDFDPNVAGGGVEIDLIEDEIIQPAAQGVFSQTLDETSSTTDSENEYESASSSHDDGSNEELLTLPSPVFPWIPGYYPDLDDDDNLIGHLINILPDNMNLHNETEEVAPEYILNNPFNILNNSLFDFESTDSDVSLPGDGGPLIWEVTDDNGSSSNDEWETASEEEIIGGDEEDLGKEEYSMVDSQEESNSLGDIAPAH
jgi:ribosomal protein S27E